MDEVKITKPNALKKNPLLHSNCTIKATEKRKEKNVSYFNHISINPLNHFIKTIHNIF